MTGPIWMGGGGWRQEGGYMETYRAESLGSYGAVHTWKAGVHNGLGERGTSRG